MKWSNSETIAFSRRPVGFLLAVSDCAKASAARVDVKELQRRAYDRGVEVERSAWTNRLDRLLVTLENQIEDEQRKRAAEEEELKRFAISLAMETAGRLTGSVVNADSHNPRNIVNDILGEIEADGVRGAVSIHMHPDDHQRVTTGSEDRPLDGVLSVQLVQDPSVAAGNFKTHGDDVSHYTLMTERLDRMKTRLLRTMEQGS